MLTGKRITLAITGSVAAYKTIDLCRSLIKKGAELNIVMSNSAQQFIGPITFSALCGTQPITDLYAGGFPHIQAGQDIDLLVVAPATANTIAKLAGGIADDIVSTTVMASDCPVIICPAMNEKMWLSKATVRNTLTLSSWGYEIIGPKTGSLACGQTGVGRLENTEVIESAITNRLLNIGEIKDKRIMVTAGPTREYLDPVRFLSNPSSGKVGYAIAEEAVRRGGETILISGPTHLARNRFLKFIPVVSAKDLSAEIDGEFDDVDALIMTAAVSDHRFREVSDEKQTKDRIDENIQLIKNPDILKSLSATRKNQILIGFAAETDDIVSRAQVKLKEKNLDFIVSTKVGFNEGFDKDSIEAVIVDKNSHKDLGMIPKRELAVEVINKLAVLL